MKYVIIGNGIAALRAAESIRGRDTEGSIAIISGESFPAYSRPLTAYLLAGWVTDERMPLRDSSKFDALNVQFHLGRMVEKIDRGSKNIELEGGEKLPYDKLLLATGASPRKIDIPGADLRGVQRLRTWNDSREILERLQTTKSAVVIGGGFVGMSSARSLASKGIDVTVVVSSNRILSQTMPLEAAEVVRSHVEEKGIRVMSETDVVEVIGSQASGVSAVKLANGDVLACELVIVGKGVDARLDLAQDAGLKCDEAMLIDAMMRTNDRDIYAAGDCTQPFDLLRGQQRSAAIWPNAAHQGRIAGANMAGAQYGAEGFYGMNSLDFWGLSIIAGGLACGGDGYESLRASGEMKNGMPWFRQVVFDGNNLVGFVVVGDIEKAGILNGLVRKKVDLRHLADEMLTPGFDMMKLPQELRKEMLGTVNPLAVHLSV